MRFLLQTVLAAMVCWLTASGQQAEPAASTALRKTGPPAVRVAQLIHDRNQYGAYPNALPTLLREINKITTVNADPEPEIISSFADPLIFDTPFVYVNFDQRSDWTLTAQEVINLRKYLERGGFILVDAGITAEFLRQNQRGQHHSFAEWKARPELQEVMKQVYPTKVFKPLPRSHPLFSMFYRGLPDATLLPEAVRDYVVNEKWPQGTYSMVGMEVKGRIAVLATPIIAMGWGRSALGTWETTIGFRIRESAVNLDERLKLANYEGERFEVTREDDAKDIVYCAEPGKPSWVREPDGRYRMFTYRHEQTISDYAHTFYTQLGVNIVLYALTH